MVPFKCPKCKTATYGDYDNCPNCGEDLTIRCLNCGHHWRFIHNYKFCPKCGTKVSAKGGSLPVPALPAGRRQAGATGGK